MKCPFCGKEHPEEALFCPVVGKSIRPLQCAYCGEVAPAGYSNCARCGNHLANAFPVEAPLPAEPLTYTDPAPSVSPAAFPIPRRTLLVILGAAAVVLVVGGVLLFSRPKTDPFLLAAATLTARPASTVPGGPAPSRPAASPTPAAAAQTPTLMIAAPPACSAPGQKWTRPADQMTMVCVPAGSFTIGQKSCDYAGCEKEVNGGNVALESFWIDQTEVTNAMFAEFVTRTNYVTAAEKAGVSEVNGNPAPTTGADWRHPQGLGSSIDGKSDHPVVQINWYGADAYCQSIGMRLPSEAQWEKAARGEDGRLFPWGNAMPGASRLNAADVNLPAAWAQTSQDDGYRYTAPVGSYPAGASPYGLLDMAGNAWEWTRSLYKNYPYKADDGRELLQPPAVGDRVVMRGGGWYDDYGSVRSTLRYGGSPSQAHDATGFRCAAP